MHAKNPRRDGYDVRDENGDLRLQRFANTIDPSLELTKLREVYKQAVRNSRFSCMWHGKEYTQQVINVTFKYSYKEWNKHVRRSGREEREYYVKAGYLFDELEFSDCTAFKDDELAGILVNTSVSVPVSDALLGNTFRYDQDAHEYKIRTSANATLKTRESLRHDLYANGFVCDGIRYVRFKRSSGSSRVGKCLFINEQLYSRMNQWSRCGVTVRKGAKIDLAAWESSISLTMSSIIGTLHLEPENILLIEDEQSTFMDTTLAVGLDGTWLTAAPQTVEISNCIWDGQSLLDESMFANYQNYGMLLLRTRFFKSACFRTDIQQFFKDNGITEVSQLNGKTRAKKIEDIKLITTPSSVKYLKFGDFDTWLDLLEPDFGIVKHDKPTHYFDGRMVQAHYQLLNTLHMSREDVEELLRPSYEYLDQLEKDPAVLRFHVKRKNTEEQFHPTEIMNDIVFYFLGVNDRFASTRLYHNFKRKVMYAYRNNLKKGHVLVHGTYATLVSNPYEMLLGSIGRFTGTSTIPKHTVSCSMFAPGSQLLGSRSPHVAAGNVLLTENVMVPEIERYFTLTPQIVCINTIGENILERLSGADMDSDTMLLTDNPLLVEKAALHYEDFLVPTKLVPSQKKNRYYTDTEKADLDHVTSGNKIGEIVNLSQELNSLFWDRLNSGSTFEEVQDIYCDIAKLDVLSNIEIDRAKRECVVNSVAEMNKIRQKYAPKNKDTRRVKPFFFAHIARSKGYYNPTRNYYKHHQTTMDYVQEVVSSWRWKSPETFAPLSSIFQMKYYSSAYVRHEAANAILRMLRDTSSLLAGEWLHYRSADEDEKNAILERISQIMENRAEYIRDCGVSVSTIYYLIQEIARDEYDDIRQIFFKTIFGYPPSAFRELVVQSNEMVPCLTEDPDGEIQLFGFRYKRDNT